MSMDKLLPSGKHGMEDLVNFVEEMNEQPVSFGPNAVLNIGYYGYLANRLTETQR